MQVAPEQVAVTPSFASSPWIRRCPHSGFSFARRTTRRAMPGPVGGRPGLRRLLVSYFLAASLRFQASSVAGVTGKTSAQRLRGTSRASAASQARSAGILHPAGVPPQDRVLVPEHQQLSVLRQVAAEHQDSQAEYPAREQVDDLEQHPASQSSPRQACRWKRRSATQSSIRAVQAQPSQWTRNMRSLRSGAITQCETAVAIWTECDFLEFWEAGKLS